MAMQVPVTALYAALCALILMWLSIGAGRLRGKKKISVGAGGDSEMIEAMRRHANAVENIPIALILIGVLELNGAGPIFVHVLGAVLVLSRIAHPLGLKTDRMNHPLRAVGAGGTFFVIFAAAVSVLWQLAKSFS